MGPTSVQITLSNELSGKGSASATPLTRLRLVKPCRAAFARAYGHISGFGSTAVTFVSYEAL